MRRSLPLAKVYPKCPVEQTLDVVGGRWKAIQLFHLLTNPSLRHGELRRKIPAATQRMLTLQLRELERHGCIDRKVYPGVPARVEYSITEFGRTLHPVVAAPQQLGHGARKGTRSRTSRPRRGLLRTAVRETPGRSVVAGLD